MAALETALKSPIEQCKQLIAISSLHDECMRTETCRKAPLARIANGHAGWRHGAPWRQGSEAGVAGQRCRVFQLIVIACSFVLRAKKAPFPPLKRGLVWCSSPARRRQLRSAHSSTSARRSAARSPARTAAGRSASGATAVAAPTPHGTALQPNAFNPLEGAQSSPPRRRCGSPAGAWASVYWGAAAAAAAAAAPWRRLGAMLRRL